jgi:AraC family transcriptional regulator, regulatory protein of adaptative response / methylphosphotriester-DNA alkyltransferase methyltransferase
MGEGETRASTQRAHLAIFEAASAIVGAEFAGPVTVRDVAQLVAISPRQLQRVFAEVAGMGFRSYLREVRMCHAAELLATTELPVKEIARQVGYRDPNQFAKAFKRAHGVIPSQSRAAAAGGS